MDARSSSRSSRAYTRSMTSSLEYSSSSIAHSVRKYSSPALSANLFRSYSSSKNGNGLATYSSLSFFPLGKRNENLPSDSGYWSSSSTPKSQTRASSETPSVVCSVQKEDISSVMSRYLPGGYVRDTNSKPNRAGSMSNLSLSLMSSLTSLSCGSSNFMASSVLDKRASRKRRELLASTRATSVERSNADVPIYSRRQSSVDRTESPFCEAGLSQRLSKSRSGSLGRMSPELECVRISAREELKQASSSRALSSLGTFDSSDVVVKATKRRDDEEDPSGLLKIQEGLARVTEALNRHQWEESKSSVGNRPSIYSFSGASEEVPTTNKTLNRPKSGLIELDRSSTYSGPRDDTRRYSLSRNPLPHRSSYGPDKVDDIVTASLLTFKKSEGSISGRRPWRRGRIATHAFTNDLDERSASLAQSQSIHAAEARLAQRRAARAEARELRLRELEKQQQQNPENNDDASDVSDGGSGGRSSSTRATSAAATACTNSVAGHHHTPGTVPPPPPLPQYTRHSSEESNPDDPASSKDLRELEEKFRGAMISNAQLDNEKTQLTYQVELLKDVRADITEQLTQLKKEHKKKCSEHEQLRKVYAKLQEESRKLRRVLEQRDELIQEYGLVVVGGVAEEDEEDDEADEDLVAREETEDGLVLPRPVPMKRVLLSQEAAEILEKGAAKGSLEWRLRRVVEHKRELEDELRRVNLELEEQVNNQRLNNCLDSNIQKEANKTVNEYKFRVQRAEAEVSSLQANVNRLEVLVTRYKTQVEELEKSEEELKVEKRKLQRELREAQGRLEELETTNSHLLRRFEKLKNARSNLLKDLSQDPV
ncbi:myosin-1 isoform X3 [Hyalella azteca]|uniref:Myosin-1 isoform X3 n=1 Tax=Hyalella azteca TaxID=294128 RepID=A0A979FH98_HYAAZ|nr:myosin-1 isoform X3 [Hyalella azteca]